MKLNEILTKIRTLPVWSRIVVLLAALLLGIVAVFSQSCSTIRVIGNEGSTTATVRQSALDSMEVNIKFNPLSTSR